MVMIAITDFKGVFGGAPEVKDSPQYDAEFPVLQAEILRRVEEMISPDDTGSATHNAVVAAASGILREFAHEAESPCVRRIGKDIDLWDERIGHLREMADMTSDLVFESVSQETGLPCDDPRLEKLRPIAAEIAALVSVTLEASIEAVKPNHPTSAFRPTI
ncbi:hypothetical protein GOB57_21880 [Sinorhizobium meliloti]|nr:hypothetical protein [Sinorhizobium meliloti]